MSHILIEKLHRYKVNSRGNDPEGYEYDAGVGYWRSSTNGSPLVSDENIRKPMTKKADVETGEDKKGE
jgi:hypothetical protein